jgi:hypothetical protein
MYPPECSDAGGERPSKAGAAQKDVTHCSDCHLRML